MKTLQRSTRNLLLMALVLGAAALVLPGPGSANTPMSHQEWVETEAAQLETADGRCPDGEICKELCEVWDNGSGVTVPLGTFECFAQ